MREFKGYFIPKNKLPFWDKLIINGGILLYQRYKIIGIEEKRIPINAINSVTLNKGIFFCTIVISSMGERIVAEGFTNKDGKEISTLLGFN